MEALATSRLMIPSSLNWYCNSPRLNPDTYTRPREMLAAAATESQKGGATLVHVIHIQRHHKRTPDNTLPKDEDLYNPPEGWHCYEEIDIYEYASDTGGQESSGIRKNVYNPQWNPFKSLIWNGTCDSGELTPGGFADSIQHGRDVLKIYGPHGVNRLFDRVTDSNTFLRTSPEPRTFQVAKGFLIGMGYDKRHNHRHKDFPAHFMPSSVDNIVPSAPCSYADQLRSEIMSEPEWMGHLSDKQDLFDSINKVLQTQNETGWNSWIDHAFDFLSSRQCHGHALPRNPRSGLELTQDIADQVYAEGNWEYKSPRADDYVKYSFAGFVKELSLLLESIEKGDSEHLLSLFIGHDGTMIRLFKTLAMPQLRWPAMGSEVDFEVYKTSSGHFFARVLANGEVLSTTAPALSSSDSQGGISGWVPLHDVTEYLKARIPQDFSERCAT